MSIKMLQSNKLANSSNPSVCQGHTRMALQILVEYVACLHQQRLWQHLLADSSEKKSLNSRIFGSNLMPVIFSEIIIISSIYTIVTNK